MPGGLEAWDPVNQKLMWRIDGGSGTGGGTLSTASNLVFDVTNDGRLRVLSADKGEKLLDMSTGRIGAGSPIRYDLNGRQYIAFVSGTGKTPRTEAVPTDEKVPDPPLLFVYTLDGHAELPKVMQSSKMIGKRLGS